MTRTAWNWICLAMIANAGLFAALQRAATGKAYPSRALRRNTCGEFLCPSLMGITWSWIRTQKAEAQWLRISVIGLAVMIWIHNASRRVRTALAQLTTQEVSNQRRIIGFEEPNYSFFSGTGNLNYQSFLSTGYPLSTCLQKLMVINHCRLPSQQDSDVLTAAAAPASTTTLFSYVISLILFINQAPFAARRALLAPSSLSKTEGKENRSLPT